MTLRGLTIRTVFALLVLALAGCGLKGDLVQPEKPADEAPAEKSE
jgi:predicted small lipoprotein YifL